MDVYNYLKRNLVEDPVLRVDEFQGVFSLSANSDVFKRLLLNEEYERELVRVCLRYFDPNRDVVDVGANVGFYSVMFANQIQPSRKVIAIEPTTNALERLYSNLARNNLDDKVLVFEGVLSDQNGMVAINIVAGKEEYSSIGVMGHPSIVGQPYEAESVPAVTLDALVEKYSLRPGFIKVDVEGSEMNVFAGGLGTLARHRPVILSELNDGLLRKNGTSAEAVVELIERNGYLVIDPFDPKLKPGSKQYGDIICIPSELGIGAV